MAEATGIEPAISGVTDRCVNHYTTPPRPPPTRPSGRAPLLYQNQPRAVNDPLRNGAEREEHG